MKFIYKFPQSTAHKEWYEDHNTFSMQFIPLFWPHTDLCRNMQHTIAAPPTHPRTVINPPRPVGTAVSMM